MESIPASYITSWILGHELPSGLYVSTKHKTTINVAAISAFLTSGSNPIDLQSKYFFELHHDTLSSISEGVTLWNNGGSEAVLEFRKYVESNWFIVVKNTQLVERWVNDSIVLILVRTITLLV